MVQYCGSIYSPIFVSRSQIKALSVFFSNSLHADREKMKEESCLQKKVHILLYSTAELNKLYTSHGVWPAASLSVIARVCMRD